MTRKTHCLLKVSLWSIANLIEISKLQIVRFNTSTEHTCHMCLTLLMCVQLQVFCFEIMGPKHLCLKSRALDSCRIRCWCSRVNSSAFRSSLILSCPQEAARFSWCFRCQFRNSIHLMSVWFSVPAGLYFSMYINFVSSCMWQFPQC